MSHFEQHLEDMYEDFFLTPAGTRHCDEVMGTLRRIELRCVEQVGAEDMARMHDISTRYLTLFKQELDS